MKNKLKILFENGEDFTDNKKAMINSIAEREICTIILDYIVHETPSGTTLVTDPDEIKKLSNNHFQLCPAIYNNIMDPPSWDEWIQSVSELSNKKTTGPFGISNEMIKHLSDEIQHILFRIIAMVRLRISEKFTELVLSLFTNRKNSVFTPDGNTNPYNVLIRIDQEELSESKDNLEKILEIADDFYNFTDIQLIQVNKQKSELLLRIQRSNFKYNDDIQLNFGNQQITIKPIHPSQSIRILGVWFNMNCSRHFVINQIKDEV
ncbi:unnamed protein product [Rhizophagus irregularis]|nr:unnamed protein product [Rhizophagus irregularis]